MATLHVAKVSESAPEAARNSWVNTRDVVERFNGQDEKASSFSEWLESNQPENLEEEGRFGNISQNTTNQGYQQDR